MLQDEYTHSLSGGEIACRSTEDVGRLLDAGVAETVRYVARRSAFYRARMRSAGVSAGDVTDTASLARLPTTTKADLAKHAETFWCVPRDKVVDIVTTSGTTGEPTLYPLTLHDVSRLSYNECLSLNCATLGPADTVLLGVTMDRCIMAGLAYFEGLVRIGAAAVRVGSGSPAMLLNMLERLEATAIISVPSFLRVVAEYAASQGIALADLSVRKLVCIGEPVRDARFALSPMGARIARDWGARVFSTYGATEIAGSLCECSEGQGGHSHPELVHIEILDDAGEQVADGEVGELVVTTIGVEALPLVRFRTGDLTFMRREPCACGRFTPRIGPILGRKNHVLKIKGTSVYPAAVQQVLSGIDEVQDFAMIATSSSTLCDELEVLLASKPGKRLDVAGIREALRGEIRVAPEIRVVSPDLLAELQTTTTGRKKRVFIDRR